MRSALRSLAADPTFTVIAVLTIALGIAANTAIFSIVYGVLLQPLPYPDADRIVQVWTVTPEDPEGNHSAPDFIELDEAEALSPLAGFREAPVTIVPAAADPVTVTGAFITTDYFEVFGVAPLMGRTFSRTADDRTNERLAVLSERAWRDTLASDPAIVGRRVQINSVPHTIVGVMPASFDFPLGARAWILSNLRVPPPPMDVEGDLLQERRVRYFSAVGRLKPGETLTQAEARLRVVADDLARREPKTNKGRSVALEPLHETIVGDVRLALLVLLGAVGGVLLIACANVASLLLARASRRQRELAIRAALGASRGRLIRQLLGESFVLAAMGGALGLLVANWAVRLLVAIVPDGLPRSGNISIDWRVASAAVGLSVVSALLVGLLPSLQASRPDGFGSLKDSGDRTATGGRARARTRSALVVAEVALTLVLLVTAGLLANSFLRLSRVEPGFAMDEVTLVELSLPPGRYPDGKQQAAFYEALLEALRTRGEIERAAIAFPNPLSTGSAASGSFTIEGRPAATRAEQPQTNIASISPEYLQTVGIPLLSGRHFTDRDRDPAPAVAIVNAAFARQHFPGEDALAKRLRFGDTEADWITIVGVAGDTRNLGLDVTPEPLLYVAHRTLTFPFMGIVVQSSGGPAVVAPAVRAEVRRLDPELPIDRVRPLREVVDDSVAEPRFRTMLLGAFAVTALLLAAIGVYGLISYSVAQRTREIGIRVALGARPAQVVRPILREGLLLALTGVALGLGGALATTKVIASFLFGIEATDPLTFAGVAALLLLVALLASYVPSRRALKVDPLTALRAE